jgi:hypothetical protein
MKPWNRTVQNRYKDRHNGKMPWSPWRLRTLLALAHYQLENSQNGWSNTFQEVNKLRAEVRALETERDAWQRQAVRD